MMTSLGKKGWLVLGSLIVVAVVGVWVWQAGYIPEIGKFFAAEPPGPPYLLPTLNGLLPDTGPAGTTVTLAMSAPLPPENEGRFTVVFGGTEAPIYRSPEGGFQFLVPPVRPGNYPVALRREASCNTPSPTRTPRIAMDAGLEAATRPPSGCMWQEVQCIQAPCYPILVCPSGTPPPTCTPLPPCAYEGEVRCAIDPVPGTVFCPQPTPTITPPLPTCYGKTTGNPVPFTVTEGQCVPRPACLDSYPWCDIAEPADGWCPPTGSSISVTNPFAGGTVAYGTQLPIQWEPRGAAAGSPTVVIELVKNDAPGGLFHIELSASNTGEYIWDTTRILTGAFGQTIDLRQVSGDAFQIKIGVPAATPEEYVSGLSGTFSIKTGIPIPTYTPTPTPTSTLPPTAQVVIGVRDQFSYNAVPGAQFRLDLSLLRNRDDGIVVPVTGLNTVLRVISGRGRISQYVNGDVFPDVIRPPVVSRDGSSVTLALGIGTNNDPVWVTGTDDRMVFGTVDVTSDTPGDRVCIAVDRLNTDVSAFGSAGDVFDMNYRGDMQWCLDFQGQAGRPGDLDGDGDVDIFDYNMVVSNFGRSGSGIKGDGDGDGDVDIFDYNLVVTNFGR